MFFYVQRLAYLLNRFKSDPIGTIFNLVYRLFATLSVTPGDVISAVIGTGGSASSSGSNSTFGSLTFPGGKPGLSASGTTPASYSEPFLSSSKGQSGGPTSSSGVTGDRSCYASGGSGGSNFSFAAGGGGGGAGFGAGANGATTSNPGANNGDGSTGSSAASNSGAGGGGGSGGKGSAAGSGTANGGSGGSGGSGKIIVMYFKPVKNYA